LSRLDKIDMQKLTQWKTAQGIEKAAESGGLAGAFVGVGVGGIMQNGMANAQQNNVTATTSYANICGRKRRTNWSV
jgi:membrane protease subunit (stomatin/prohibitin family)